jgi:molybdenum cofactor synthesis domain-containing protein
MEGDLIEIHLSFCVLMEHLKVGVVTCSDRCARGEADDVSGPAIIEYLEANKSLLKCESLEFVSFLVEDDRSAISSKLLHCCDDLSIPLVFTTGGTGFAPRDITPEATKDVLEKETPGIVLAMLNASLAITPHAMLSRPAAGIRKRSLIINLPGSPKAVKENIAAIIAALPHAIALILDIPKASTKKAHQELNIAASSSS